MERAMSGDWMPGELALFREWEREDEFEKFYDEWLDSIPEEVVVSRDLVMDILDGLEAHEAVEWLEANGIGERPRTEWDRPTWMPAKLAVAPYKPKKEGAGG